MAKTTKDQKSSMSAIPAMAMMEACMQMGTDIMAFGAKRLEKDLALQKELMTAKPGDVMHIQMKFWQGVIDDYQEETARMLSMAHKAGMPDL